MERDPSIRDRFRVYWRLLQMNLGFWLIFLGVPVLLYLGQDFDWWDVIPKEFQSLHSEEFIETFYPFLFEFLTTYTGSDRNTWIIFGCLIIVLPFLLYRLAFNQVKKEHECRDCGAQWAVYPTGKIQRWDSKTSVSNYKKTEVAHSQIGKGLDERDIFKRRVTKKVSGFKINQCVVCGAKSAGDFDTSSTVLSDDVTAVGGWRKRK